MSAASFARVLGAALLAAAALSTAALPASAQPSSAAPGAADLGPPDSLVLWPEAWRCGWLRDVEIVTDNVFLPDEPAGRSFHGRLTNALHVTTQPRVVRRGLHLRDGQRVCREDIEAALRRLRGYGFLHSEASVEVEAEGDSVDLAVRTRDVWSTRPTIRIGKTGSLWTWTARLGEHNLLGLGKKLTLAVGHDEQQPFWSWGYGDPQLLGGVMRFEIDMTRGSDLRGEYLLLERVFERPETPWGLQALGLRHEGSVTDRRGGADGPEWERDLWLIDAWVGPRVHAAGRRALRLMPAAYLTRERYADVPGEASVSAEACGSARAAEPLRARDIRAIGLRVSGVIERYERRRLVDLLGTWEDLQLGSQLELFLGYSARRWEAARDAPYARLRAQQGLRVGRGAFALLNAEGYGLLASEKASDALLALMLRGYAALSGRQTLALRLEARLTRDLAPQELPTMGAEHGLRGFDAYRFWGEGSWVASLEDRVLLAGDILGLVALGGAVFLDAGATWFEECRGAALGRACAGVGLRLQGSRTSGRFVTRVDLGYPVAGRESGDDWVLSLALGQAF